METLTLEHLSAYLPYGLKGVSKEENLGIETVKGFQIQSVSIELITDFDYLQILDFKPILYPLSSLTETIWYEGKEINSIEFIKDWFNESYGEIDNLEYYELENEFVLFGSFNKDEELEIIAMPYQAYQLLFKMKIDVFSLIEKGLAVDVNTLETNPYK